MPQLDPSTFTSQLFWFCLTFLILYVGIQLWAAPNIKRILHRRWNSIDGTLNRAERLAEEARILRAEAEATLLAAHQKSVAVIREAQEEIAQELSIQNQLFAKEMSERLQDADDKIQFAKQKALMEAEKVVLETTTLIINKLLGQTISPEKITKEIELVMRGSP